MSQSTKLGLIKESIKKSTLLASHNLQNYALTKRNNFLSKPIIFTLNNQFQHLVSPENIEHVKMKCDEAYHKVAGTEVTEVQDRARELESKLNMKRKNMLEAREQMDNVNERLRGIAVELENARRGDPKHLHLRQLEYDTIQEEMKLSKLVQKTEFSERETFTWLMNAVRESHETERNYNQRIKMLSLIGAIIGPFIGYMFSARLNANRFRRMEDIINRKLELLSFTTLNAIREIHDLEPEVMSDSEKEGLVSRIFGIFNMMQSLLIESYNVAVSSSSDLLQNLKENTENNVAIAEVVAEKSKKVQEKKAVVETKPQTKETGSQVTTSMPVERIVVEKIIERLIPQEIDYANLPEFKSLMGSLKTIEEKQDNLKQLLITSQELHESGKIEVSVNSSDDEIISMLQADQQMVRKLLLSVSDLLQDSRTSLGSTLNSVVSNIESLSMKISNNSELYVGNLEHSKIVNDIVKSLEDVKSSMDTIETYNMNGLNKQSSEMTNIHGDLSKQIDGVRQDLDMQSSNLDQINDSLVNGFNSQDSYVSDIGNLLNAISGVVCEIEADNSVDSVIDKVDQVTAALAEMRSLLVTSTDASCEKLDGVETIISNSLDKTLQKFEESILSQYQSRCDALMEKIDEITIQPSTITYNTIESAVETEAQSVEDVEKVISDNLDKTLQKFEENIISEYQNRHEVLLEKIDEISKVPPTVIYSTISTSEPEPQDVEIASGFVGFPEEILDDSNFPPSLTEGENETISTGVEDQSSASTDAVVGDSVIDMVKTFSSSSQLEETVEPLDGADESAVESESKEESSHSYTDSAIASAKYKRR
ncbi:uncharacterized protein LOC134816775 [Bolinopsis microptera]|uniref:uncharacterized protein LOC134816775 n=1 Tax=Bolinopsis microptera TaxID=2820187 RepID=UPI0030794ABB